ncbi:hypothetical protein H0H92_012672 [Tricholoma furcatifolium]|nr:hypothetical protein H0H92_012672 [Tricholoma furcatifolium]
MGSRRLDISSLLCDEQVPEPVILAPHLRQPRQSSSPSHNRPPPSPTTSPTFPAPSQMLHSHRPLSSHSHPSHHHHSPSYSLPSPALPSPSMTPKLPSFGLEALVQAATEERRRLSVSGPPDDAQRRLSPNVETRHVQSQHFPQQPPFRQHKPSSPLLHHSPTTTPSQPMLSPVQLIRSPTYSSVTHHRHRDEQHVRLNAPDDVHYRSLPSPYFSPPMQSQPARVHDHRTQQQEFDRQRIHHEQLLLQEQQQQKYARERQATYADRQILPPPTHSRTPSMPLHLDPPSRHLQPQQPISLSHPPVSGQLHTSGRKSDPGQPHMFNLDRSAHFPPHPLPQDDDLASHPNKKRRYSDSPVQTISAEERDRIQRERDKMEAGDLGYGRPEPNDPPRRPGSGYGHGRKHIGLGELMSPNYEVPRAHSSIGGSSMQTAPSEGLFQLKDSKDHSSEGATLRDISREPRAREIVARETFRPDIAPSEDSHESGSKEGVSRVRRRSPPGSESGRAIAAKKSEEVEHTLHDLLRPEPHVKETLVPPPPPKTDKIIVHEKEVKPEIAEKISATSELASRTTFSGKDNKLSASEKEHKKRPPSRTTIDNTFIGPHVPAKKQRTIPAQTASVTKPAEEDAHEWFLEHFDDYNVPAKPQPHLPEAANPPASSTRQLSVSKMRTPTPTGMPDAADALEQELEELLVDARPVGKVEPNSEMEVDLVTELVVETLEAEDTKPNVGMEVDVEDELLSLLDDQPSSRRPVTKAVTPAASAAKTPSVAVNGARHASPSVTPLTSAPSPAALLAPVPRPSSTRPVSERGSMPPPASVSPARGKEKEERDSGTVAVPIKKKKDTSSKATNKTKAIAALSAESPAVKSRAKPGPKPKPKPSDTPLSTVPVKSKATGLKKSAPSRSRSTSAMPSGSAGPEGANELKAEKQQEEEEDSNQEDNKLYCVCKTTYDEDRFMIACDRPRVSEDVLPPTLLTDVLAEYPNLHLKTTYKTRCLYGLRHADPSSTKACHRPARGAFSKYCSDECGVKYMQSRVDAWAKKGGKKDKLWESVKDSEKREGVVVCVAESNGPKMEVDGNDGGLVLKQKKTKADREVERLNKLLDSIVKLREDVKKEMEGVIWREKLLELASERAEQIGECGWDQRLCFGDDECADLGAGVLESYDVNLQNGETAPSGKWWCSGKKVCDRHAGWQAVRVKDVCKEKEKKNDALLNLTTREREIRKRIEDILDPHGSKCDDPSSKSPLKTSNAKLSNGHTKGKTTADTTTKKGKKRKAPS